MMSGLPQDMQRMPVFQNILMKISDLVTEAEEA